MSSASSSVPPAGTSGVLTGAGGPVAGGSAQVGGTGDGSVGVATATAKAGPGATQGVDRWVAAAGVVVGAVGFAL